MVSDSCGRCRELFSAVLDGFRRVGTVCFMVTRGFRTLSDDFRRFRMSYDSSGLFQAVPGSANGFVENDFGWFTYKCKYVGYEFDRLIG